MHASHYSESLIVHFRRVEILRNEALNLKSIDLSGRQHADLELLLNRGMYPLDGYMTRKDYEAVLDNMRLNDGTVFPLPVCLDVNERNAKSLTAGERVALNDQEGVLLAILTVRNIWKADKKKEAEAVFGTSDSTKHPGVVQLCNRSEEWYIGGALEGVEPSCAL